MFRRRSLLILMLAAAPASGFAQQPELIGQTRWIAGTALGIKLCERPADPLDTKCEYVKTGKVRVVDARPGIAPGSYRYLVNLEDGRSGYMQDIDLQYSTTAKDPSIAAADCKRRGEPAIGMTTAQVIATCWGKPSRVNRTETGSAKFDQFVYATGRYVYLRNGTVESIQTSGRLRSPNHLGVNEANRGHHLAPDD